ncbi:O-antigen ligase family protein [Massilia sp. PWRC2]|uniref:O-antigen ligase family protein n=1 Tax=Massilia sp. PWRC2 TaxID=2804626 RepID=UPI003CF0B99A
MTTVSQYPLSRAERAASQLFLLALFAVAFSTALTNVFVGLAYLSFLLALASSAPLRALLRQPRTLLPGLLALLLLALYLLAVSWTVAPRADVLTALKKYSRLLILPMVIVLAWRDERLPRRALTYCLAGLGVLLASIYLTSVGLMPSSSLGWWRVSADTRDAFVFRNHISIGILLGFASSAALLIASHARRTSSRVLALAAAVLAALPIMFLSQGRTGFVVLLVGLITVFLLRVRLTPLRVVVALAALTLAALAVYATSANVKSRTDDMINEIAHDKVQSPNGLRVSFIAVGLRAFAAHPLIGVGTGGFAEVYAPTAKRNWPAGSELALARHQPHSEFMLVAVQLGALGLLVYFAMLTSLARAAAAARRTFAGDILIVLLAIYIFTSAFNSLLWDTTEAHWFLLLAGCLYVGARRQAQGALAAASSA